MGISTEEDSFNINSYFLDYNLARVWLTGLFIFHNCVNLLAVYPGLEEVIV